MPQRTSYVSHEMVTHLVDVFARRFPDIRVRVVFDFWLPTEGSPPCVSEAKEGSQSIILVQLNPHCSYIEIVNGLIVALSAASFWTEEDGLPDPDDLGSDHRSRMTDMAKTLGDKQWFVNLEAHFLTQ